MSDSQLTTVNETTLKRKPVIKLSKAQKAKPGESELLSSLGLIRDILIYESSNAHDPILGGQYKQLKLKNYYNRVTNSSRTFANALEVNGANVVRNSDVVTKAIGQKSYDLVFHALCSVLSNETKIKAMLALLTVPNKYKDCSTQTDSDDLRARYDTNDAASQTDVMTPLKVLKKRKQFRNKKKLVPYVVPSEDVVESQKEAKIFISNEPSIQTPQRIIINPKNFKEFRSKELPILEDVHKDLDQESDTNFSDLSIDTVSTGFEDNVKTHLNYIDQRTDRSGKNPKSISEKLDETSEIFSRYDCKLYDGSVVTLPTKPKTVFHIATRDNLAFLTPEEKRKVIHHQAFEDWKLCLQPYEEGNLPIHLAVIDNDVDFLVRQCVVLRARKSHVDVFPQKQQVSALHMAIMRGANVECIKKLLQFEADPFEALEYQKTAFHRAAEAENPAYLEILLQHVAKYPRELMMLNESLSSEDIKSVTSEQTEELANYLYRHIGEMSDEEGYTPLMLASKSALHQNVKLLLEKCPSTVNVGMKTSGNTALYLAVEGAGMEASERGDKSRISGDYLTTMEYLLNHHADPTLENFSGQNVNNLLTDFGINPLSMFVARTMSALRDIPEIKKIDELMFIREAMEEEEVSVVTYKSRHAKEHAELRSVRSNEPGRISGQRETQKEKQTPKQGNDRSDILAKIEAKSSEDDSQPTRVDLSKKTTEQSKPIILENIRLIPEKTVSKDTPTSLSGRSSSLIELSLKSQLSVPKKTFKSSETIKQVSVSSDILKRKLLEITDLEEKKFRIKIIKKST